MAFSQLTTRPNQGVLVLVAQLKIAAAIAHLGRFLLVRPQKYVPPRSQF
jgi:hypothetical protein